MRRTPAILLSLCTLPSIASAHGFVLYVSTPITPPQELVRWFPIALTLLVTGAFLILWRVLDRHWMASAGLALVAVAAFAVSFFMICHFVADMSNAMYPERGSPHPAFWGMGWARVGWLFVRWNLYGYGFLLASLFVFGGVRRTKERFWKLALSVLLLYTVCVVPYLATGALVHGWGGGYVKMACDERLRVLNTALVAYAEKHGGTLPEVDGMTSLLGELQPFVKQAQFSYSAPVDICPLGRAYERNPKHYIWNTNFSGVGLQDIDPDRFFAVDGVVPITCPYHDNLGGVAFAFMELVLKARLERSPNQAP